MWDEKNQMCFSFKFPNKVHTDTCVLGGLLLGEQKMILTVKITILVKSIQMTFSATP